MSGFDKGDYYNTTTTTTTTILYLYLIILLPEVHNFSNTNKLLFFIVWQVKNFLFYRPMA